MEFKVFNFPRVLILTKIQPKLSAKCTLSKSPLIDRFLVLGSDYDLALQEIAYYRVCHEKSQLIQDYVTFHLYAEIKYANQLDINSWPEVNCEKWTSAADSVTFKQGEYRIFFSYFFGQRLIIFLKFYDLVILLWT